MKKQLRFVYLLGALVATVSSCAKNELVSEAKLSGNQNKLAWAGDKEYDVLGHGYDVTGFFADSRSAKAQVLQTKKYVLENVGLYLPNIHVSEGFSYSFGENAVGYSEKMTQSYKMGLDLGLLTKAKAFKADFNASFARKDSVSAKFVYGTIRKIVRQKGMRIFYDTENLINNYLTDQFKLDIQTLSADLLIQRYGTHVLTDVTLGSRLDVNYEAETTASQRQESAKYGADITAWKVFSIKADITTNSAYSSSNFNQTLNYSSLGGDGTKTLVGQLKLDNSSPAINIADWQSTCTRDNAVLVEIGEDGLLPITDLIADPVKKQQVKDAVKNYLEKNAIKLAPQEVYEFYSPTKERHAYNLNPRMHLQFLNDGWGQNGGSKFRAYNIPYNNAVPIYQLYNSQLNDRILWPNPNPGWGGFREDGILFYAYTTNISGTVPVYSFVRELKTKVFPNRYIIVGQNHYYSTNPTPYDGNWRNGGVAFYAFPN